MVSSCSHFLRKILVWFGFETSGEGVSQILNRKVASFLHSGRCSCHFSPLSPRCGLWFSWACLETAAEIPKCVISHPAPSCTQLHTHSLEGAKQMSMMALALLDWPALPATKQRTNQPWFPGHFPGLTIGKVPHSWLHCQVEHQRPQTVGPKEELLTVTQLLVEIICFSREAGSWLLPPPLACSTNLMLSAAIKG